MSRSIRLFTFAAPSRFFALSGFLLPWLWLAAIGFALAGLYMGFFVAPTDATQGDSYRIIFVHVPAAWMSMVLYLVMAGWAVFGWAANARLASMVARALAPAGAIFTFSGAVDRRTVGQAHLGHLVGLGCPADVGTNPVVPVSGIHGLGGID